MRVVTASLILHHGLDKLGNVQGFSQGVIEYSAQMPGVPNQFGFWPAFWMLGQMRRHIIQGVYLPTVSTASNRENHDKIYPY